jgi:hypothetical protein
MSWHVPLADVIIEDDDLAAVTATYRSGWLSMGPRTEEFEAAFAAYTGAAHALAVANGTAALHLICQAAGLGAGDEVIVPSLTFVATVNAVAYTGATPVFADIVSLTEPWLSAAAAEAAITSRTRAIMNMTYGGHCGETEALAALCAERGLILLEDTAHAAGSRLRGRSLGTFGRAGAFSLFSNKNLAVGEGGVVVTDDDELAAQVRLLRSHGMTTLTWDRHRGHASGSASTTAWTSPAPHWRRAGWPASTPRTTGAASWTRAIAGFSAKRTSPAPWRPSRAWTPPTTCSRSCSTTASTGTRSARRSTSAGSRRACITRPSTASPSTPTGTRRRP